MWERVEVAVEWDMAWFCDKCEKMESWKTKGWRHPRIRGFVCNECKEKLEKNGIK